MKLIKIAHLASVFVSVVIFIGCEDNTTKVGEGIHQDGGSGDTDVDTDVDSDVDTDADSDSDTDSDTDGDSDSDADDDPCAACTGFTGADILVVVDNSISMEQEQKILATGFYTLINSLVTPTEDWKYPPATNIRVGIVSSDLGMQFGNDGEADPKAAAAIGSGCDDDMGDDGAFINSIPDEISVANKEIKCDPEGGQCPGDDWSCNDDGLCETPDNKSEEAVACADLGNDPWAKYSKGDNEDIANQVACMAQLGTEGCGVEQQLQAAVRALSRDDQSDFIDDKHLLAVLVVSDEEDCSIKDDGLFDTPEWNSAQTMNTACNLPESNEEDYLFDAAYFRESLVDIKGGNRNAVIFAAIVGVPPGDDSPCQGLGDSLGDCLDDDGMQYIPAEFETSDGDQYWHLVPACERMATVGGEKVAVTSARPGRRYVKVAQEFGCAGYVYSICNEDWSSAMSEIARLIASCIIV